MHIVKHVKTPLASAALLLLFTLSFCPRLAADVQRVPYAEKGVIDLREWNFSEDGPVSLDGEWEFYWSCFLSPGGSSAENTTPPVDYFILPGYWNQHELEGRKLSGQGYASFRLTILLPPGYTAPLAVKIRDILTAYTLFIDGEKITETGRPGTTRDTSVPFYSSRVKDFIPGDSEMEIIIHVSNFQHRKGGIWESIILGTAGDITKKHTRQVSVDMILMSAILIMSLYHIGLFLLRRNDVTALYFGLFCLVIALRVVTTGELYLYQLLPNGQWRYLLRLEYLSFYTGLPVFLLYLHSLFPVDFSKKVLQAAGILTSAFSLVVLILPARIYTYTVQPYQAITVLAGLYSVYILILAIAKKREGAPILLTGFLILFSTVVNDMLHTNQIIHSGYYMPAGLLVFIFSQAYLIALRSTKMFRTIEEQTTELKRTNTALSREIIERKKLEQNLIESHERFQRSRIGIILGLAKLAEYRDEDTGAHLERIREYSKVLAQELSKHPDYRGYITGGYIDDLYQSSILHDIGKVGVPDSILLKPARLTPEEFDIIKRHTLIGGEAIQNVELKIDIKSFLTLGKEIAFNHHEKWDGSGYPRGIGGKNIPLSARIVSLADVYDALRSERPYKKAFSHEQTRDIILEGRESHFDPDIVDVFLAAEETFLRIHRQLGAD